MVHLVPEERRELVALLGDLPELLTPQSRLVLLQMAGYEQALLSRIPVGAPTAFQAAAEITHFLAGYGRVADGPEALGMLLNLVKGLVGHEQRRLLNDLLRAHSMMTPAADAPDLAGWSGTGPVEPEKIFAPGTLRPIVFLEQALAAARSVALVRVGDAGAAWTGTGFLLAADLLITNHHVLPDPGLAASTTVTFGYENDVFGRTRPSTSYSCSVAGVLAADATLDYAVVELTGEPGRTWGCLSVAAGPPRQSDRVNIIQHPGGLPKQIALQGNQVQYVDGKVVQYLTATNNGSSGSPVLTDSWEVCALHHSGGRITEPGSGRVVYRNEGTVMGAILDALPADVRARIAART